MRINSLRAGLCVGALILAGGLTACGGGGGGSAGGSAAPSASYPNTGFYVPQYRWTGMTPTGVSLLHSATPTVEYVVSAASGGSSVTDTLLLQSEQTISSTTYLQVSYLLYVQGGTMYELPLQANGSKPVASAVPLGSVTACAFPHFVYNYTTPQTAEVIVSTAGADGRCGTADDGQLHVSLANPVAVSRVQNPGPGYSHLGFIFSGVSNQSSIWLESDASGALYTDAGNGPQLLRAGTGTKPAMISARKSSMLLQDGNQLSLVSYSTTAGAWQVTPVSGTSGAWTGAGTDSNNYYVYATAGTGASATWQLLSIPLTAPSATQIGSGAGTVSSTAVGRAQVFVSAQGSPNNYLYLVAENGSGTTTVDTNTPNADGSIVSDGVVLLSGSKDILVRTLYQGTNYESGEIDTIDETGAISLLAANASVSAYVIPQSIVNGTAYPISGVSFVTNRNAITGYSGGSLETFDSSSGTVITNGTLPTSSVVGGPFVGWASAHAHGATGGLYVDGVTSNGFLSGSAQMYYYNPLVAGSLTQTTVQQGP